MQMAMYMKEIGRMTKLMGMESTIILMEPSMKGIGSKTNSMAKEKRHGLMVLSTKVNMLKEEKMEMVSSFGQMGHSMKVSL